MSYKFLKISSYYKPFLDNYYKKNEGIITKDYAEQYNDLINQKYSWSNFFQIHLKDLGVDAYEIISNASYLQNAWAKDNNIKGAGFNILISQIKTINPDVIFIQNSIDFNPDLINLIRSSASKLKLIFGNICSPFHTKHFELFASFDFMLTCSTQFAEELNKKGIKNYMTLHAFESSILNNLKPFSEKENEILFIGSFFQSADFHDERIRIVEELLNEKIKLTIHGNLQNDSFLTLLTKQILYIILKNIDTLNLSSLYKRFEKLRKISALHDFPKKSNFSRAFLNSTNKPLYGLEMYQKLAESSLGLNIHGGIVKNYAANIRMFEVTGVGSCLITDFKPNLKDLFDVNNEIVTFKNKSELISKAKYLLDNPNEAMKIALEGQKRTLKDHSLKNRINQIHEIILKELKK